MNKVQQNLNFKKVDLNQLASRLKPGRHHCDCQARVHKLIRNCLTCGRIVCEQEGSGPCFYCSALVCTLEEREILKENSPKSRELLSRLMGEEFDTDNLPLSGFSSLARLGQSMSQATQFKDKLLQADKSTEITQVRDLDNDYFTLEMNPYLTSEEREAIVRRKDELKELERQDRRKITIDLNLENLTVEEKQKSEIETVNDPIIQSILRKSMAKRQTDASDRQEGDENFALKSFCKSFIPRYCPEYSNNTHVSADLFTPGNKTDKTIRRIKGTVFCLALKQPYASMLMDEEIGFFCIPWKVQLFLRCQVVIGILEESKTTEKFNNCLKIKRSTKDMDEKNQSAGALIGRTYLKECLTWREYREEFPEHAKKYPVGDKFVLIFTKSERFPQPIPFTCQSEFFELDRHITANINQMLLTDSLFDDVDLTFA